jgi:Cytochrome oxidase complex assembly protein 1
VIEQKSQPPPLPGQKTGWFPRNWKWFVPALCAVAFVCAAISFGCVMIIVSLSMKSIGAYKMAIKLAEADSRVTALIGSPQKEGWFIGGAFNVNGASGNAELAIPLSGPRAKGTIYVVAKESAGEWTFSTLVFQVNSSGERINLQDNKH